MPWLLAEAAPVELLLRPLIIPLLLLAGALVAFGVVYILHNFTRAVIGGVSKIVRRIPGIGGILSGPLNAVYHWMDHEFGAAEAALDNRIGLYYHQLAHLVTWVGKEIGAGAHLLYTLSSALLGHEITRLINDVLRAVHRSIAAARHELQHLERQATVTIPRTVRAFEHRIAARTAAIAGTLGHVIEWDIPRLRLRDLELTRGLHRLWERIRTMDRRWAVGAFAGAVAFALARLGIGWVRCSNVAKTGKALCRANTRWLEDLLIGTVAIFGTLSLIEFAVELYGLTGSAVREVAHFWRADVSRTAANPQLGDFGSAPRLGGVPGTGGSNPGLGDVA